VSDLGPQAKSILAAGRSGDDPTPADRARVRRSIGKALAAGGAAGAAATKGAAAAAGAAGKAASLAVAAKLAGALVLIGAVGAGAAIVHARRSAPAVEAPATGAPAPIAEKVAAPTIAPAPAEIAAAPAEITAAPAATPSPPPAAAPPADPASPARPAPRPGARIAAAPSPADTVEPAAPAEPAEDPLVAETRRLREAHGALKAGDAEKALRLLDEPAKGGELGEERAAARVLVLCKLGRADEANAAAARFLRESPRSPLADRVRAGCPQAR
jgi:hypothetical protein